MIYNMVLDTNVHVCVNTLHDYVLAQHVHLCAQKNFITYLRIASMLNRTMYMYIKCSIH